VQDQPAEGRLDGTDPQDDLFVSIGDLSGTRLAGVQVDANQEDMVEDYIDGFNQMVLQGMPPIKALFAMAQAFGLALGYCIRCGLHPADGRKLLGMLIQQSKTESQNVKIVTGQTVQ
jgi:hypothetical protein